jgi:hypothetical protein
MSDMSNNALPAPFIVGVGRSGTTLLRLMLDSHPDLTIPAETHFVPDLIEAFDDSDDELPAERVVELLTSDRHWVDFDLDYDELTERLRAVGGLDAADALRTFYGLYAEKQGKPRWGDKTPIYVKHMVRIQRTLPEARFIHLIRDGRDAALSRKKRSLRENDGTPITRPAELWRSRILKARNQSRKLPHYIEVRYEDLVTDPEPTLHRVCQFLDLPFDPMMLTYHERAEERLQELAHDLPGDGRKPERPGAERLAAHAMTRKPPSTERLGLWKEGMAPEDRVAFEEVAGDLLDDLGYEVGRSAARKARAAHRKGRRRRGALRKPVRRARKTVGRWLGRGPASQALTDYTDRTPVPFVVGVTRSGTTLLRLMLDAHPALTIPPETHFVPDLIEAARDDAATPETVAASITGNRRWGDFHLDPDELLSKLREVEPMDAPGAIRAFFELYAEKQEKPRWGDKTPIYINRMLLIQRHLPEARFIHLIRDGRDAALSRAQRNLTNPTPMDKVGKRWKGRIIRAREQASRLNHYLELRYEDLVRDPETPLRRICEFIELDWDDAMLRYYERAEDRLQEMARDLPPEGDKPRRPADHRMEAHALTTKPPDPSRLERWRTEMSPDDLALFEQAAGDLLTELGYPLGDPVGARGEG